ncbi:MAG: type III-B CRISPR-associated protein Cas10/Cmr2 [Proteobacteria bacterium]|nr:type III-B CRISPR-associated protein Cas10/Cmr2 [Pseudomonadota bacterium]
MSTWLVEIAFGPVQGYIAAARRSRDLWAGSRLLSEVVRAAGVALLDGGAELIYPLASRVRGEHADEDSNLSNVLLAQVEADSPDAVARLTRAAQEAGRQRLLESADGALASWRQAGVALREDIWQRQAADALECFAGWCRSDGDYKRAYEHTKVALGARKKTRDFAPMFAGPDAQLGLGIPKSSLDGLRESVLPKGRARFPPKFGVAPGEQLDTLGCIKRVAGRSERFTALTRMAADGWLQGLAPNEIAGLNTACERLVPAGLATRSEGNGGIYASFPYDAGLLYPERLEAAVAQARAAAKDDVALLESFASVLRPLWKKHGRPCPYAAIVVADGDRMGRFIDKAASAAQHTQISAAIADFADEVPDVCRQHRGHSIYNGGEDVMALFPLADLVHGCRALAERFDERMRGVVVELLGKSPPPGDRPSLRVGAAICHVLEPLGLIRAYGDAAEKFAKGDAGSDAQGNALGLHLHSRGGHVVAWRARFDAPDEFARLEAWRTAFIDGSMPGKLPYRIRQAWLAGRESGLDAEVIHCEIRRTITHANERGGGDAIQAGLTDALQARARQFARAGDPTGYGQLIDELILARWLAARSASDLGREGT